MAKIIVRLNDTDLAEYALKQGDMSIGRRTGSEIHLDNPSVSGRHASVFTAGEESFIEDLNSTNGTFLNDRRISKQRLTDGDVIAIGKHTLTYVNPKAARASDDLAKTVVIAPKGRGQSAPPAAAKPSNRQAGPRLGSLFVMSGGNSGKRIDLSKSVTNLGRAGKIAGAINRALTGAYTLVPGKDGETLRLNGVSVGARGAELHNGDVIEIAGARMQFYFK
jgi:pSer/pThr/pTyr-binding forkhead associated (FHA) protein